MMQANTGVRFETKDPLLSQLVKQAEEKCRLNIKNFGGDPVLVEGGGYEKNLAGNPAHGRRNVCQP